MTNIVKYTKKYRVRRTVSYPDPLLGVIILGVGDVLEQCVDEPQYFSNGLCLVTEANILHRVPEFFELITPVISLPNKPRSLKERLKKKIESITIAIKSK